jgi:PAS domain S-box-containing protein
MDLNEGTGSSTQDVQLLLQNYEQMRAVFTLSEAAGRAASLADIYTAALASLQDALGVERAAVLLFDPAGIMRFKAWVGLSDGYRTSVEGHTPWSSSEPNPQPVLLADVRGNLALQVRLPQSGELLCDVVQREGIHALAMVPLVDQGALLGKFMVYYPTHHDFDVEEVRFMLTLASTIAFAITRKRAEEALRESEQRYRLFVQNFTGIAYQLEQGHRLPRLMEGASVDICGYPADAFLRGDVCWPNLIDDRDRDRILQRGRWLFATQDAMSDDEYRVVHRSGEVRWVRDIARHVVDEETGRSFIQGAMYDMTDRKRAEEERLEMERRLLHAQKLESMGVLAGGIAHDFNNLLLAISGNLELAQLKLPQAGGSETASAMFLSRALSAVQTATGLAHQMLAYSGRGTFQLRAVNLSALVQENTDLLRAAIAHNRELTLQLAADLLPIQADPSQVQQVIMNLITNAAEAMGEQGGQITLTTGVCACDARFLAASRGLEKPPPGRYAYVQVEDNGCGMSADVQQRLFDPFFTTKVTGRGLGMAAVLGIIRSHHGAILVHSTPGAGTTVQVLFPLSAQVSAGAQEATETPLIAAAGSNGMSGAAPATTPMAPPPQVGAPHVQRRHVLVADDEPMVRSMCQSLLGSWGYSPLLAADGEEAVTLFRAHADEIACVVLDLTMPRLDGLGALKTLRQLRPGVRVILTSGYSQSEALARFDANGDTVFIQKPYQAQSLHDILDKMAAPAD